jgi:phospholipid-translocating ATPase
LNKTKYDKVDPKQPNGIKVINAKDIKVGQVLKIKHNERIPADMLLLLTTEKSGAVFIRTDQLDGETDWKLRKALTFTQNITNPTDLIHLEGEFVALAPNDKIYDFKGYYQMHAEDENEREPLALEHTMWQNTVMAS